MSGSIYTFGTPDTIPDDFDAEYWNPRVVEKRRRRIGLDHALDNLAQHVEQMHIGNEYCRTSLYLGWSGQKYIDEYTAFAMEAGEDSFTVLDRFCAKYAPCFMARQAAPVPCTPVPTLPPDPDMLTVKDLCSLDSFTIEFNRLGMQITIDGQPVPPASLTSVYDLIQSLSSPDPIPVSVVRSHIYTFGSGVAAIQQSVHRDLARFGAHIIDRTAAQLARDALLDETIRQAAIDAAVIEQDRATLRIMVSQVYGFDVDHVLALYDAIRTRTAANGSEAYSTTICYLDDLWAARTDPDKLVECCNLHGRLTVAVSDAYWALLRVVIDDFTKRYFLQDNFRGAIKGLLDNLGAGIDVVLSPDDEELRQRAIRRRCTRCAGDHGTRPCRSTMVKSRRGRKR